MINPDTCSCCGEIWNRDNLKNIPLGKHELHLCPDCYAGYIKQFNEIGIVLNKIQAEIEKQKEGDYACFDDDDMFIYTVGLNVAIGIIDKYKTKPKDIEAQATEFLAEARACAER